MRTISVRVTDLIKTVLPIGFAGENLHTRVNIDCRVVFDEYPTATVSMTVRPPKGDAYPAIVVRDGDIVTWDVSNSDLLYEGSGELQLSFVVNEVIAKSFIGRTRIQRSIIPTGEIPDPIEDWITKADEILDSIPGQIDTALEEAKESGEFDGADGFSPEVSVSEITGGHQVSITDSEGTSTFDVMDGENGDPGQDGFSPEVSVSEITGGHQVSITDAEGTSTFDVMDGDKGDPGDPGSPGEDGFSPEVSVSEITGGHQISITDAEGTSTFDVMDGEKGDPGNPGSPGQDGFSPSASVSKSGNKSTITITDKTGTTTAEVLDGSTGPAGPGVASGGTTGQVLKKKSNADYDTEWGEDAEGVQIDDSAGIGDTGVTWSANKSATELSKKYVKPSDGIPSSDMTSTVQTSLGKADTAYQKPSGGVPSTDMTSEVQTSLGKADTAYQKPSGGIPSTDMTSTVQTSLGKADSAYQKPSGGIPASDIANGVIPDVSGKADKVSSATSGDFAGLDSNGNLTDSGSKASDFILASLKGSNNGVAELDASGRVPSSQLPSYVDDVEEYSSLSAFPATGESGKIYIALDTNRTYRWSGSSYVAISSDLALGETSSTAYRGDRGADAYAASVTNVETTPTSGSSNLITSGAVYTGLESVDNQVIISDTQPTATSNKLWIDSDDTGTEVAVPTYAEMATGLAGKVSDVQVNGTSVVTSGVANVPVADTNTLGVVKVSAPYGVKLTDDILTINPPTDDIIKAGSSYNRPLTPVVQQQSVFYGLAKAAGADMASLASTTVGQYPDAQKIAIQKMLGIYDPPYVLLNDVTVDERTCFDFATDSNGTPYNLLSVFIEVYYAADLVTEDSGYGRYYFYDKDGYWLQSETGRYITNALSQYKLIEVVKRSNLKELNYTRITNTGNQGGWYIKSGIAMAGAGYNRGGYNFSLGNITRIAMHTSDKEPAGTRIKIWGQWAY